MAVNATVSCLFELCEVPPALAIQKAELLRVEPEQTRTLADGDNGDVE